MKLNKVSYAQAHKSNASFKTEGIVIQTGPKLVQNLKQNQICKQIKGKRKNVAKFTVEGIIDVKLVQ